MTGAGAETGLIVARNVHKRYGRKRILNGVELTVPQGKVMALLGANGAGKSTLMRIISGLATPDRGEVRQMCIRDRCLCITRGARSLPATRSFKGASVVLTCQVRMGRPCCAASANSC